MLNKFPLLILLLLASAIVQPQEYKSLALKLGVGAGMSQSSNCTGMGTMYSVGYQRDIWKDRLRFNPNLSVGFYSPVFITDLPNQYFNSIIINANLNYDLIRINRFSVVVYAGLDVGITQGLIENGSYYGNYSGYGSGYGNPYSQNSYYIQNYHVGGNLGGGFRILSKSKKTALNILPFNFRVGYLNFLESNLKLEIDINI